MKRIQRLRVLGGLLLAAFPLSSAIAQASAPAPSIAASVAPVGKPEKRILTPSESRDSATAAGELRPERRVTPQISIPLDKSGPVPPKSLLTPPPRAKAPPSGGIDDAAARCGALADAQARDQCREKLKR
jgi:hypothetical protein